MKPEETHTEIGDLLRSRKPEIATPPGLEGRILREIGQQKHRPSPIHWWRWFLIPPAAALLMVVFSPKDDDARGTKVITRLDPLPPESTDKTAPENTQAMTATDTVNPLERESQALKRDAERAGKFLLECLPSVTSATEKR